MPFCFVFLLCFSNSQRAAWNQSLLNCNCFSTYCIKEVVNKTKHNKHSHSASRCVVELQANDVVVLLLEDDAAELPLGDDEEVLLEWQLQLGHVILVYAPSSHVGKHDLDEQLGRGSVDSGRAFQQHGWWTGGVSARTAGWGPGTSSCTADTWRTRSPAIHNAISTWPPPNPNQYHYSAQVLPKVNRPVSPNMSFITSTSYSKTSFNGNTYPLIADTF